MVNKIILIGNLGKDPEVRYTQGGSAVVNFNMATTESWKKDGVKEETTEWHRIVGFGNLAEICGEYLTKGSKIYLEGKIQTRKWEDRDGNTKYTTEIVMREMKMLGGGAQQDRTQPDRNQQPEGERQNNHYSQEPEQKPLPTGDDVPF